MKLWWVVLLSLVSASAALAAADRFDVKDAKGKVIAVVLLCNDCPSGAGGKESCQPGAGDGWLDGKRCGSCLVESNWGTLIHYSQDLRIVGKLAAPDGKPAGERFIKLFLPNGWTVRSKTNDVGAFRLMLGATDERTSREPIVVDIGTQTDTVVGEDPHFSLFLMPVPYKPCQAEENGKKN